MRPAGPLNQRDSLIDDVQQYNRQVLPRRCCLMTPAVLALACLAVALTGLIQMHRGTTTVKTQSLAAAGFLGLVICVCATCCLGCKARSWVRQRDAAERSAAQIV
jgi:hypothetical protein